MSLLASGVVAGRAHRARSGWCVLVLLLIEGLFLGTVFILSEQVIADLRWWVILIGNLLAVGTMALCIWMRNPGLRGRKLA